MYKPPWLLGTKKKHLPLFNICFPGVSILGSSLRQWNTDGKIPCIYTHYLCMVCILGLSCVDSYIAVQYAHSTKGRGSPQSCCRRLASIATWVAKVSLNCSTNPSTKWCGAGFFFFPRRSQTVVNTFTLGALRESWTSMVEEYLLTSHNWHTFQRRWTKSC